MTRPLSLSIVLAVAAACGAGTGPSTTFVVDTVPGAPELDGFSDGIYFAYFGFPVRTGDYDRGRGGTSEPLYRQFFGFLLPPRRADAVFRTATLVLDQCVGFGAPFAKDGAIVVDHVEYGSAPSVQAYDQPSLSGDLTFLSSDTARGYHKVNVTAAVLADWAAGRSRSEFRARFVGVHTGDGVDDYVVFRDARDSACQIYPGLDGASDPLRTPKLLLRYQR